MVPPPGKTAPPRVRWCGAGPSADSRCPARLSLRDAAGTSFLGLGLAPCRNVNSPAVWVNYNSKTENAGEVVNEAANSISAWPLRLELLSGEH